MLNKKNYILFIILIILVGLIWTFQYLSDESNGDDTETVMRFGADILTIDKFSVFKDNATTTIVYQDGGWVLEPSGWPAEKILIDTLISKLSTVNASDWEIVSVNLGKKDSFGVGTNGTRLIISRSGEDLKTIIFGNVNNAYSANYLSFPDDEQTYLVPETFVRALDVDSWPDRTITEFDAASVANVTLAYSTQTIQLTKDPDESGEIYWRSVAPTVYRLTKQTVDDWLEKISALEAIDISFENLVFEPELTITITGNDISEELALMKQKSGEDYYVKKIGGAQGFYIIGSDLAAELMKTLNDFRAK